MLKHTRRCFFKKTLKKQLIKHLMDLKLLKNSDIDLIVDSEDFFCVDFNLISQKSGKPLFSDISFQDEGDESVLVVTINEKNVVEKIIFSVSNWKLTPKQYIITEQSKIPPLVQTINFDSGEIILHQTISESLDTFLKEGVNTLKNELHEIIDDAAYGLYEQNVQTIIIKSNIDCSKHFSVTQEIVRPVLKPESDISFKKFHNLKHIKF